MFQIALGHNMFANTRIQGGREVAEINRPNTKEPPILIDSDGTVF